ASGSPVAQAHVVVSGPKSFETTTNGAGVYTLSAVPAGTYTVTVVKAGFETTVRTSVPVVANGKTKNDVALTNATLQTIAAVKTGTQVRFNTTSASVGVATAQDFKNQAQNQVFQILNQIPGVQISLPSGSTNGAAPGSVTVPTVRGAASYETASFIDGHAVATSSYGDYVTTYLNPFLFGDVEVVKGPGAFGVEVNSAINGAINFKTRNPTATPVPDFELGATSHGGAYGNVAISDSVLDGRLGFVVALANVDEPSALNGTRVLIDPSSGYAGSPTGTQLAGNKTYSNVGGTLSNIQTGYSLVACCYTLTSNFNNTSELLKLRYRLSPSTVATVSYLDGQTTTDQNGNTGNFTAATFTPGKGYKGSLPAGPQLVDYLFPGAPNVGYNVEPIFQAEVSSAIGDNDTILARYYHGSIYRETQQGSNASTYDPYTLTLYGSSAGRSSSIMYNGTTLPVYFQDYYNETESDKLNGWSFEYDHPFSGNELIFSIDQNGTQSQDYSQSTFTSVSIPQGSSQLYSTIRLQGNVQLAPQVTASLADYANVYRSTYATSCPFSGAYSNCAIDGSNVNFATTTTGHNDPRFGFVWQPHPNVSVRFAAGSAIAPPYLYLLSQITAPTATWNQQTGLATLTKNSGQLRPETAFGYDLGADYRFHDAWTVASVDAYDNNLYNHYFGETTYSGLLCNQVSYPCLDQSGKKAPGKTPIYYMLNTNISNFRFQGIEAQLKRSPRVGWGFDLAGALQRGYVFNLPAYFYCSNPGPKCQYNQNLNIIANQNLNGEGIGSVSYSPYFGFGSTIGSLNTRIPYAQGNASVSYTFRNGAFAMLGMTYYGNNNSLGEPPFGIGYVSLRYPVAPSTSFQISGNNIFNAWPGVVPVYGGGVSIPLANSGTAATLGNVLGPANWSFVLTRSIAP
ncbi:MAG: TonB-dependent receptor, partial [Candidatus Eremiobacteraeota bacterium]|nr:TonB-dependent receptor [Candidatus Eremiobacteraeota bacterium]